jgi:KUP system potassium uptake protein
VADASASPADEAPDPSPPPRTRAAVVHGGLAALTFGALGVVFGDIGTSPLYALQTVFTVDHHAVHTNAVDVYGVISLVFWSVTMVVSVKYVTFIMRADNGGEGGIMALTALLQGARLRTRRTKLILVTLGVLGASLFYGDGMITPAISVLSAVEGLEVPAPGLSSLVLPITVAVITALFMIQRRGTGAMGRLFGPIMGLWFGVLAILGAVEIAGHPGILKALSPTYGVAFFSAHLGVAFVSLGSVVLAVTGAEALYADMGHFGRRPITRAWFLAVFPALTLNYLGQGALILHKAASVANPFFLLAPGWAQLPLVILATVATVIASQSVISGAFSVTGQAVQLGFLPRLTIRHTSAEEVGQIYVPGVNGMLFVAVVGLVIGFGSSAALANAYGVAVTGTFILNTILFLAVARFLWHKPRWMIGLGGVVFLTIEVAFFAANLEKVAHGGWLPLAIAAVAFTLLMTWHKGRQIVTDRRTEQEGPLLDFVEELKARRPPVPRVAGTAVFPTANPETTPLALRANVEHNNVVHEHVIIISLVTERVPHVPAENRLEVDGLGDPTDGMVRLRARFGYQDAPYIPATLGLAIEQEMLEGDAKLDEISYFLSQITIVETAAPGLRAWRKRLFLAMAHNAASPVVYFGLPDRRTVIMGERVEL